MGTRENRGQERKSRNNAFKYFAIEEWIKEGSQEKKGRKPGMQDTRTERGRGPPVPPLYGSSVGYLLRRRISSDTLGKERDH